MDRMRLGRAAAVQCRAKALRMSVWVSDTLPALRMQLGKGVKFHAHDLSQRAQALTTASGLLGSKASSSLSSMMVCLFMCNNLLALIYI